MVDPLSNINNDRFVDTVDEEYQPRTLTEHNLARLSILPMYPPSSSTTTTASKSYSLLSNVPSKVLNVSFSI